MKKGQITTEIFIVISVIVLIFISSLFLINLKKQEILEIADFYGKKNMCDEIITIVKTMRYLENEQSVSINTPYDIRTVDGYLYIEELNCGYLGNIESVYLEKGKIRISEVNASFYFEKQ
ncbi:MAG: hypothetical protein N3D73_02200 [Candidatus Diapherotrites archaeon]|nr:hypothetical protein [Candidatus Diapherotrites archaeon]